MNASHWLYKDKYRDKITSLLQKEFHLISVCAVSVSVLSGILWTILLYRFRRFCDWKRRHWHSLWTSRVWVRRSCEPHRHHECSASGKALCLTSPSSSSFHYHRCQISIVNFSTGLTKSFVAVLIFMMQKGIPCIELFFSLSGTRLLLQLCENGLFLASPVEIVGECLHLVLVWCYVDWQQYIIIFDFVHAFLFYNLSVISGS